MKSLLKSEYKGVHHKIGHRGFKDFWVAGYIMPNGKTWQIHKNTEREAAIAYDKKMIELGREPVNVFKRKAI